MTQASATATSSRWKIDSSHTIPMFAVKHMMISTVRGSFGTTEGWLEIDEQDPTRSRGELRIDVTSIDTRDPQRDGHLRAADFFDTENHPWITFASKRVEPVEGNRYRVVGDLTIRGTTREVVVDTTYGGEAVNPYGKRVRAFTGQFSLSRKDYGLEWNMAMEAGGVLVGDEVKASIELEAVLAD